LAEFKMRGNNLRPHLRQRQVVNLQVIPDLAPPWNKAVVYMLKVVST
jgi:hypothetical protein